MIKENALNSREVVYAALEGRKADRLPVATPYVMLVQADRWSELTGLPAWKYYEWLIQSPEEHAKMYPLLSQKLPFDILQPTQWRPGKDTYAYRENTELIYKDDKAYYHFKKEDTYEQLKLNLHESNDAPEEKQIVFDKNDVNEKVIIEKAETMIANGCIAREKAAVDIMNGNRFILTGGILNTFYYCSWYVGLTNLYTLLYDEPELIQYLSEKLLEKNIERIRALASAGGDAIYIDDATATSDMISPRFYEQFSLPYLKEEIKEIKRLGKKAVVIYYGGVADRIEQIVSSGADAMIMEASMKGYVNDLEAIGKQVNGRMCLYGNLNPYEDIEISNDNDFTKLLKNQISIGKNLNKYIISNGSPLTPTTGVSRINKMIDIGHTFGRKESK